MEVDVAKVKGVVLKSVNLGVHGVKLSTYMFYVRIQKRISKIQYTKNHYSSN